MSMIISSRLIRKRFELPDFQPAPTRPSYGVSREADAIDKFLEEIQKKQNISRSSVVSDEGKIQRASTKSTEEKLYDVLAGAKVMTSQVAMHMEQEWREGIFEQLDELLNIDDWHDDDEPVLGTSFTTFIRMVLYQKPKRRPGLGVSHRGNLIGSWTSGPNRLTLEFLPGDMIRWVLSCEIDGEIERGAGETPVRRLPKVLDPYQPSRWFDDAG